MLVEGRASLKLDDLDTDGAHDTKGDQHDARSIPVNHTLARRQNKAELQPLVDRDFPDPFLVQGTWYEANGGGSVYHLYGGHGTQDKLNVQRVDVRIGMDRKAYTEAWHSDSQEALPKVGGWVNKWDDGAAYDAHGVTSPYVYQLVSAITI